MRDLLIILSAISFGQELHAQSKQGFPGNDSAKATSTLLDTVTLSGKKPAVQLFADRTVVNVDASVTNTGATILEVLEKSPGISVDKNGNISLRARQGVNIMIDGKPVQVTGTELTSLLTGLTAAEVDEIEIIDNPSSRYDASGNAGVINIKTKKNRNKGVNGNINLSLSQGRYTRSVNSISLSHYSGKLNVYTSVTSNMNQNFSDLYALRSYFAGDNKTVTAYLEQPSFFKGRGPTLSLRAGADYYADKRTTIGLSVSGSALDRKISGNNDAVWKNAGGTTDSVITTVTDNRDRLNNFGINVNVRHSFNDNKEITAEVNYLGYRINNSQHFTNTFNAPGGYLENLSGNIPGSINIFTGKSDYTQRFKNNVKLEAGWKSSIVHTDNRAEYFVEAGANRVPDLGKTNHFIYDERIHALYGALEKRAAKFTISGGIRYELTNYNAQQLGNALRKDSSFSRKYDGLFPTMLVSLNLDSSNTLSLTAGRRIDRPPFQSLNPFVFVINKYTYQSGNPFYRPQFTWNTELSHTYKNLLVTSLSYSITKDYFSQIFYTDTNGIFYYSEGNLDKMQNIGLSVSAQVSPASWWSLSAQAVANYKKINGYIYDERQSSLTQLTFNISNQLTFAPGWSGELSGFYTTKELELQEITDPTGQVAAGVSKQLFKSKATLKLTVRDIFYTQTFRGNTTFNLATEYFRIARDTRFASIGFIYRFGKLSKTNSGKNNGADDEIRRAGGPQ